MAEALGHEYLVQQSVGPTIHAASSVFRNTGELAVTLQLGYCKLHTLGVVMTVLALRSDLRVRIALRILDGEPNHTISGLAVKLRLSKSRFSHLFKAETGTSVKTYALNRRLQKARRLLLTTNMEIKEIAYYLGYRHGPSFARAFKTQFGTTPNLYRKVGSSATVNLITNGRPQKKQSEWLTMTRSIECSEERSTLRVESAIHRQRRYVHSPVWERPR
jgi:AraC-like DNA-binding protein